MGILGKTKILGAMVSAALIVLVGCAKSAPTTAAPTTTATAAPTTARPPATTAAPTATVAPTTARPPATTAAPTTTAAPAPAATRPFGELRVGVATFGDEKFDPVTAGGTTFHILLAPMYDFLIRNEPPGDMKGANVGIAEKWQVAPDGKSVTFNLRKGVKFHDGSDVTARDVKFTLDRNTEPLAIQSVIRDSQERVEVVDDYTVRVITKGIQPYYGRWVNFIPGQQGTIMPKAYFDKVGLDGYVRNPVGSGPFKFVRHVPGDRVEYEAVENHFRQVPAFKRVTIINLPEETTRVAMLKTGEADIVEIEVESVPGLEKAGLRTMTIDGNQSGFVYWGAYDPRGAGKPIGDVKVRQALSLALNRSEIGQGLFAGKMMRAMPIHMWPNQPDIDVAYWQKQADSYYKYDVEKAKQLLKDAGYPNGFSIKLYAAPAGGAPYIPSLAPVVQAYWNKIGVKTEIANLDWGTYRAMTRKPDDALIGNAALVGFDGHPIPARAMLTAFTATGPYDLGSMKLGNNKELDKLVSGTLAEPDPAKRFEMTAKALQLAMDTHLFQAVGVVPVMVGLGPLVDITVPAGGGARAITRYLDLARHR